MANSPMFPNRRRAAEIADELNKLADDYGDQWVAGRFDIAADIRAEMDELRRERFLTGWVGEDE